MYIIHYQNYIDCPSITSIVNISFHKLIILYLFILDLKVPILFGVILGGIHDTTMSLQMTRNGFGLIL